MGNIARNTVFFLSAAVSLYAAVAYGLFGGPPLHPEMKASFEAHAWAIRTHIFAALLALALGPWQFVPALRARLPHLHRWMGRAYLGIGVGLGGISGFYMALHAFGGPAARAGFALLAIAWLFTGWRAYRAIRAGRVAAHRDWMIANFSLTFAAVTLRLYLPAAVVAGVPFEAAYPVIAWLCWVPNLALAAAWVGRRGHHAAAALSKSGQMI